MSGTRTERLYYTNAYQSAFSTTVTAIDGSRVYLAASAFYPTSGGQPNDLGFLGGVAVTDVVDEGERVAHVLAMAPGFAVGAAVEAQVDWQRRFDYMQQHTGQHLLSAVFEDLFGARTVSVHFGDAMSTLDVDSDTLGAARVVEAERRANAIVLENRAVLVTFEEAATAQGLRKATDRSGDIRVVNIEGVDRSACGGTHVRATGEIGPIMIRRVEKQKKSSRVEFLCGWRTLARGRRDFESLSQIAGSLSCGIDDVGGLIAAQTDRLHALEAEQRRTQEQLAEYRAAVLYQNAAPDARGIRRLDERFESVEELRLIAQAISRKSGVVFAGRAESPPTVVFATSEDSGINAGVHLKTLLASHGGRGGGAPRVAQGTLADPGAMTALVQELLSPLS